MLLQQPKNFCEKPWESHICLNKFDYTANFITEIQNKSLVLG